MSRTYLFVTGLTAVIFTTISHAHACAPESAVELDAADNAKFRSFADFELEAISKPFEIDLYFCSEHDVRIERIKVDATMPAHQHGMNYTPEFKRTDNGNFSVSGMFFHMPGVWQLEVSAYQASASVNEPTLFKLEIMAQ
ncbi:MAG: hypothetical protein ABJE63_09715 [Lentilitoribacter sp.]